MLKNILQIFQSFHLHTVFTMASSVAISKLWIWDMWNYKGEGGRNQGTSEGNLFLQLFSGEYVFAPSSSQKGCLFQHTDNSRGWICSLSNHFPKHHGMVQQVKLLTFCRNQVEPDSSSMPWKLTLSLLMCQHRGWNHHHVMTHLNCGSKQSL